MRWQRNAHSLSTRFKKDFAYALTEYEYKALIEDVLRKGYAEQVPQEELDCSLKELKRAAVWLLKLRHHLLDPGESG